MSNIVERLDEIIAKNVALEIDGMSEAIKAHYRAAFCTEAADTIARLQAENEERRKAQPYVYIGKDGKSVLARDLEDRLIKAEAELSSARDNAAESITWRADDLNAQLADARAEALEEAAKVAERFEAEYASERDKHVHGTPDHWMNNSGSYAAMDIAAAIRRLKEGA